MNKSHEPTVQWLPFAYDSRLSKEARAELIKLGICLPDDREKLCALVLPPKTPVKGSRCV